ncbi:hypothetical protein VTJ04DRAFT_6438 [Mycothermus thermophilus]|uniref:uncharacterized protein n=1 Tax=Humicola insolens TaxID=85995 RepID=UPI0037446D64
MTRWHSTILDIKTNHTTECDVLSPGLNPVGSFYGRRCARETDTEAAQFKMSWGYNKLSDSAVVTVCFVPNGTAAWFGFEKVSRRQFLGDSQIEPAWATGCA